MPVTLDALPASIRAIADAIRVAADPQKIILFGSQARGEATADSDVDAIVVQEREEWLDAARWRAEGLLRVSIPPIGKAIDVLLFTPAEMEKWRHARNHVIARARLPRGSSSMNERDDPRRMLEVARDDLNALRVFQRLPAGEGTLVAESIFGFHAQQAVEKAMKALISFKLREFSLTHNLSKLAEEVRKAGEDPAAFDVSFDLDPFAVQQRNPLAGVPREPLDRARLLAEVEAIVVRVDAILNGRTA